MKVHRVVVATNVIVGGMIGETRANRRVLRLCLQGEVRPVIAEALFLEYEDVLGRPIRKRSPLSGAERERLLDAFLSVCDWVDVYFGWRPNLRDESDNHFIELAVVGAAGWMVTNNVADFQQGELKFPQLRAVRPGEFLKEVAR